MNNINFIIAKNITTIMAEKKIKQIELANAMGTTKQTISKMLNGVRVISAGELCKIASEYTGIQVKQMLQD